MGLFGFGKKMKEETKGGCCCKGASVNETANECCCESAPVEEPACGCNGPVSEEKTFVASEGCCACGGTFKKAWLLEGRDFMSKESKTEGISSFQKYLSWFANKTKGWFQ